MKLTPPFGSVTSNSNANTTQKAVKEKAKTDRLIRIRKEIVIMEGVEKTIVMIRDVTDYINLEDIQQKQN